MVQMLSLQVANSASWHARAAILLYTQVMVFCNLFLLQEEQIRNEIQRLVLVLLCDEQLEVSLDRVKNSTSYNCRSEC